MTEKEMFAKLLQLGAEWKITEVKLNMDENRIDIWLGTESWSKWPCAVCGIEQAVHDHAQEQTWRHLDTCQCQTFIHARLPRTDCKTHGVKQILAPWASVRNGFTLMMETRVIDTLKECDITGCSRLNRISWDAAWSVMEKAVKRGLVRKDKRLPAYIGVDEKSFGKRHTYETLVCDLERGTVEFIVDDREQESLEFYYKRFGDKELASVKGVAMDMWDPYIAATRKYIPEAEDKIVFDRYHVTRHVTEAVDKVRRQEHKILADQGEDILKGTKYLWLANEDNIPECRQAEFSKIRRMNLKTARAWAIKESLREFWNYIYPGNALKFWKRWFSWASRSRLKPIIQAARTLKTHIKNILTYFKHRITNATTEGLNSKIQMVKEMACGFRNREHYKIAIYFHCGGLDLYPKQI